LFGENDTVQDSLEGRLVAYLLNPEVAYNPQLPIAWDRIKADTSLWNLYQEVELPLANVLCEMEKIGVRIDVDMLKQAELQLNGELQVLEQQIYASAGSTFNINSPKQVGEVLFDQLRLDAKAKKSKTGQYSTSEEVLLALKSKHEVVGLILAYRELKKLISTYIAALPTYINPDTGKIHTTYNQTVTATGRLSSSNPNLQNLPIRSERGQLIRQAVIPDDNCLFLSADYSQIELRLMAHFSQDPHLVEAFRSGQDIHAATAAKIFNVPIEAVTREQRRQAKTANFGIIYGISAFGLAQQLDCSRSEAKALIDGYFAAFPGVIDYIEHQKELARQQGFAVTLFGRKRYLPDILSHNATVRAFAERNAVNSPIQGTAADIIKMAMVTIHRRLKQEGLQAKMIMQVHDELNFNVPVNEVEQVREIVVSEMQNVVHLTVPLIADCGVGKNWLEAH
jgi:DNA polymerase-1